MGGIFTGDMSFLCAINTERDQEIINMGLAREFLNRIQRMRKAAGLVAKDKIKVYFELQAENDILSGAIEATKAYIEERLDNPIYAFSELPADSKVISEEVSAINDTDVKFVIIEA